MKTYAKAWCVYAIALLASKVAAFPFSFFGSPQQPEESRSVMDTLISPKFENYFEGLHKIYSKVGAYPCMASHQTRGWSGKKDSELPLLVVAVGSESSGHQMWNMLFENNIFDCVWPKASAVQQLAGSHYEPSKFPFMDAEELHESLANLQAQSSRNVGRQCRSIYNAFDVIPFTSPKVKGRMFHHMDLASLQQLDGDLFDIKYLVLVRNTADAALSALGRGGAGTLVDHNLRTFEQSLVYMETALKRVPCEKKFIAHFEHVRADPLAFYEPLADFLQLEDGFSKEALKKSLTSFSSRKKSVKTYPLKFTRECGNGGIGKSEKKCYAEMAKTYGEWFAKRMYMWPTFAGDGLLLADNIQ